ncbi:MAG: hypothetical protein WCC90_12000 [Methylocella sp.]
MFFLLVKVNSLAGYAVCTGLQPVLAYAPRYPEHRGGKATESWRNRHIAFRESTKKPGREAGFSFVVQETRRRKAGAGKGRVNIWR